MGSKLLFYSALLLVMVVPLAQAQLGGLMSGLLGLIRIDGTIFCSVNGIQGTNGTTTPAFANAAVQLQCGSSRTVFSSTTTNSSGVFSFLLNPLTMLLSSLLNDCILAVTTPLSTCNPSLGAGTLQAPLQIVGKTVQGLVSIANIVPAVFQFIPLLG